jgi:hypothetical protein
MSLSSSRAASITAPPLNQTTCTNYTTPTLVQFRPHQTRPAPPHETFLQDWYTKGQHWHRRTAVLVVNCRVRDPKPKVFCFYLYRTIPSAHCQSSSVNYSKGTLQLARLVEETRVKRGYWPDVLCVSIFRAWRKSTLSRSAINLEHGFFQIPNFCHPNSCREWRRRRQHAKKNGLFWSQYSAVMSSPRTHYL